MEFWTVLGTIFAAISAVSAVIALPLNKRRRARSLPEYLVGKELKSKRNALEVSGEFEIGCSNQYWIHVCNIGSRENGIKSVLLYYGNPNKGGHLIDAYPISVEGHYLQLMPSKMWDLYLDPSTIVKQFLSRLGSYISTPSQEIFVLVKDLWGNSYLLNTHLRIDKYLEANEPRGNSKEKTNDQL